MKSSRDSKIFSTFFCHEKTSILKSLKFQVQKNTSTNIATLAPNSQVNQNAERKEKMSKFQLRVGYVTMFTFSLVESRMVHLKRTKMEKRERGREKVPDSKLILEKL